MSDDTLPSKDAPKRTPAFRAVLSPYRSLSPTGFLILMIAVGTVSFISGMAFLLLGAWPVFGFFGLDVALIYFAFRYNYYVGQEYETVVIDNDVLTLTHIDADGQSKHYEFNPYWVRVRLHRASNGRTVLALASHGREVTFGRFLTDDERASFAEALTTELALGREHPAR